MRVDGSGQNQVADGSVGGNGPPPWAQGFGGVGKDFLANKEYDTAVDTSTSFIETRVPVEADTTETDIGPADFDLATAVLGELAVKTAINQGTLEELVALERLIADAIRGASSMHGSSETTFERPDVMFVPNGDIDVPAKGTVLPKGVNGAFVPGKDGQPGAILLSEDLKKDDVALEEVALEELGEAVGHHMSTLGFELGDGDVGHRLKQVITGQELVEDDFTADFDGADEQRIRFKGDATVMAKTDSAAGEAVETLPVVTPASVLPDDPEDGAYLTSALDETTLEFYTNEIWASTGAGADGEIWATGLVAALNSLGTETVTQEEVEDLMLIVDPSQIDNSAPNTQAGGQFSRDEIKQLIASGAIQFSDTVMGGGPTGAFVDFAKMDVYMPPGGAVGEGYDMAKIILDYYQVSPDFLAEERLEVAMQEFFGISLDTISPTDDEVAMEEGGLTFARAFRAYVKENGGELNGGNHYVNPDIDLLRGFLGDDTQSENSILIAKDSTSEVAGYAWSLKSLAGGTVDPVDDPDEPIPTLSSYTAADIQQPNNPYFDDPLRTDNWVDGMNTQSVSYENSIVDYKDEVTNLVTQATLPTTSTDDALAAYEVFLGNTVEQLNRITTEASTAGQKSTFRKEANGMVYEEPTFVSEGVRTEMENATTEMQAKGQALVGTLTDLSKQLSGIIAADHGTIYAAEKQAELDMILGFVTMAMDTTAIMSGIATLGSGSMTAFKNKQLAKLGKLPESERTKIRDFADEMAALPDGNNLTDDDLSELRAVLTAGKVYDNAHEEVANIVTYGVTALGTGSFGIGQIYLGVKRVAAVAEHAAAEAGIELPPYLVNMLNSMSGVETDEAKNFYSDMASAGFEDELTAFAASYSVASLATDWAGSDLSLLSTLQNLNKTDGNKTEFLTDGWKTSEYITQYEMTDETYALRDLGYKVSRGGGWMGNTVAIAPWENDPDFEPTDSYRDKMEWLQDQIDENGIQWAIDQGWEIYETGSTAEWASNDMNFGGTFQVADGDERVGFLKLGDISTGGLGFDSGSLMNLGEHDDDAEEALDALYAAAGVTRDMKYVGAGDDT